MKKTILIIIVSVLSLTASFYMGYYQARSEANERAKEMILNDEIPNYYMLVWTVDYLINDANGDLQRMLPEAKREPEYRTKTNKK